VNEYRSPVFFAFLMENYRRKGRFDADIYRKYRIGGGAKPRNTFDAAAAHMAQ
jgi:hypothetical protein